METNPHTLVVTVESITDGFEDWTYLNVKPYSVVPRDGMLLFMTTYNGRDSYRGISTDIVVSFLTIPQDGEIAEEEG